MPCALLKGMEEMMDIKRQKMSRAGIGLRFMGNHARLADGEIWSDVRCVCATRANLRAAVRGGQVIEAGCPVCGRKGVYEITPGRDGKAEVGFFPMGVIVI